MDLKAMIAKELRGFVSTGYLDDNKYIDPESIPDIAEEVTKLVVENIAVLDGVSVTPAKLREMAEELHQKLFYKEVKGRRAMRALADKSALERVAELLEKRS